MADPERSTLADRLGGLRSALGRIQGAMGLRSRQIGARARWWSETYPAPPRVGGIEVRHAGLVPCRTRIETTPDRGRILRATEDVPQGEILIAEPALIRVDLRAQTDTVPEAWRAVAAIARMPESERAMILELHNTHSALHGTYAALARDLGARGLPLGIEADAAATLLGIIRTNAFGRSPGGTLSIYPAIAMVAHDCAPTCDRFVEGNTLFVQARGALAPGDEITISYVDTSLPAVSRLSALRARYGFVCGCSRCSAALEQGEVDAASLDPAAGRLEAEYLSSLG